MAARNLRIGYGTALRYWRVARAGKTGGIDAPAHFGSRELSVRETVARAAGLCLVDGPLDVCAGRDATRPKARGLHPRVWSKDASPSQIACIDRGLEVCRPPLALLQVATLLDEVDLALLMYELTGTYLIRSWDDGDSESGYEPLEDIEDIRSFAQQARSKKVRGAARLLKAADLVVPNSNSAAESALALLLMLPRTQGGMGIRGFELNKRIPLSKEASAILGRSDMRPDFLWEAIMLALEYNSIRYHLGRVAHTRDSRRQDALVHDGYDVVVLTRDQTIVKEELKTILGGIGRKLGLRRGPNRHDDRVDDMIDRIIVHADDPLDKLL